MIGIILAAGDGTRLKKSLGEDRCKVMEKVNNIRLIEFALDNLINLNVSDVFVVVGKDAEMIKNTIGKDYKGLNINYARQAEQIGLINAMIQALKVAEADDVILQLADEIFVGFRADDIRKIIDAESYDYYCGITCEEDPQKIKANYSVEIDENMVIEKCTEKPKHITNNLKGTGFCVFRKDVIELLKEIYDEKNNTPNELCDFMNFLSSNGKRGIAFYVADREFNINTKTDLTEVIGFLS
ncbi:MAG: NTP transferase domain-containing protein [Clostridia bacterium]|nr:NTP transferase domain-containing protein [Clostridia bacterium]